MSAAVYTAPHWYTGKLKTRCTVCHGPNGDGKVVYPDEATARFRAVQISARQPMRAYRGACGHWHVARIRRSPRR